MTVAEPERGRGLVAIIALLSLLIIVAFSSVGWTLYRSHRDVCQGRTATLNVLRDLLLDAEQQTLSEHMADGERKIVEQFYARQLARIEEARC